MPNTVKLELYMLELSLHTFVQPLVLSFEGDIPMLINSAKLMERKCGQQRHPDQIPLVTQDGVEPGKLFNH